MSENMINLKVDGVSVEVPAGSTVLQAALAAGVCIPTLCYMKETNELGSCRICVVEIKGGRGLAAACVYPVAEGMEVFTNTEKVRASRRQTLELILSNHRMECLTCERNGNCELRQLAADMGIDSVRYQVDELEPELDESAPHLVRDNSKCILCRRCVAVCRKNQQVGVISAADRGFATHIESAFGRGLGEVSCVCCGQCVAACPTGALTLKRSVDAVRAAIDDPAKHVVVVPAPAVRVGLGDRFGLPVGESVQGKMVAALRRLGFDKVFDVNWAADVTIMEEGTELIGRVKNGGTMPMFTSCCPGWIKYMEHYHADMLDNLSSCRSPQQMMGGLVKTYYAEREGIAPEDIVVVSIMPCTAKKFEVSREEQRLENGCMPVDYSLTTRELADMITGSGIMFNVLPDEAFDPVLGDSTGAAVIFGASGGVMEAALRTAAVVLAGEEADVPLVFEDVRGMEGVKEAEYEVGGVKLRTCTVSGLVNAEKVIRAMEAGEVAYDFIEVMACPGGCVNGAGQPIHSPFEKMVVDVKGKRAAGLYALDEALPRRRSHENPEVKALYANYLGEPCGHRAHCILHTEYVPRDSYNV